MKIKNFVIIVGTQKGGTTSLFSYLAQHPQVAASRIKEPDFFSKDHRWNRGLDYYEGLWQWDPQQHLTALEASVSYTHSTSGVKTVIERIQTIDARFKFIYILRDPLKKIESMRQQGVYQGWYTKSLEKETPDSLPKEILARAQYASIIDKFSDAFSRESILLLKTADLKNSPQEMLKRVCDFLDLDPSFQFVLGQIHNSRNSYRRDTIWHFLRDSGYFNPIKKIVPSGAKNKVRAFLSQPLISKNKTAPPLTQSQRRFIVNALQDEFVRLESHYGLDVSDWSRGI